MREIITDAIILGAGPAGAGTSIYLSKYGVKHIIIDKEQFPRDKVCGDACSGKTMYVLRNANPQFAKDLFNDSTTLPSYGIVFYAPNGKSLEIPFKPNRKSEDIATGFTAKRIDFDNYLFNQLQSDYCTVFQGTQTKQIVKTNDKVSIIIKTTNELLKITAPFIIGADGDKSIIRRQFLPQYNTEKSSAIGLRAYYKGVTGLQNEKFIELHFLPEISPGYLWIFPLTNGLANIGIGITSEIARKKKINLREMMLNAIENNPNINARFKNAELKGKILGWGLPMGTKMAPVSGEGFLLTGDAASLVDPFSGEGIGNALYSGMLAANTIKACIDKGDFSNVYIKKNYDDVLYKRLGEELKLSATMQKLCRFPWLFNLVVNKARKSESLSKTISFMFADLDIREQLKKPSFYLKVLLNK